MAVGLENICSFWQSSHIFQYCHIWLLNIWLLPTLCLCLMSICKCVSYNIITLIYVGVYKYLWLYFLFIFHFTDCINIYQNMYKTCAECCQVSKMLVICNSKECNWTWIWLIRSILWSILCLLVCPPSIYWSRL